MTLWTVLGVSLFGGLGAAARYAQDTLVKERLASAFPWGTLSINIAGSLLLGVITGLAIAGAEPETWRVVVGTGFCGGYTTFSTAMFETVALARAGRLGAAVWNVFGTLIATVAAACLGLWLGGLA